jgi:TAG lipase/steryl ester hydrolase/phospholipase A2/LPA acyltransferase
MFRASATRRNLREAAAALDAADSYAAWKVAAEAHDQLTGAAEWREDGASVYYDHKLVEKDVADLRRLRLARNGRGLVDALTATVYRHQADIAAHELYVTALAGPKHLVRAWLDEVEAALRWVVSNPVVGLTPGDKGQRFKDAWQVYGRSALMLSGGATWGFHHLGVVKALFEDGVLPDILSGASTGAMIAAGACTRTDAELAQMFADTDSIRLDGLLPLSPRRALEAGAVLDPDRLLQVLRHNVGEWTFAEAYQRSGRALNISVYPTRTRQKPRVLSHLTSPDVFVSSAALASSALPGLFPPVVLDARGPDGSRVPYVPSERWVDGSIYGDLPKLRLARLHNVNHFIVSQTNPHVTLFVGKQGERGVVPAVAGVATATARTQGAYTADVARRLTPAWSGPVRQAADRAYALMTQDYRGDIEIHPRFRSELLRKVVSNPSRADLALFIREGERATWPKLPMIEDQTRLGRVFRACAVAMRAMEAGP